MKAQEVELALEEVEKAGEEQAKFGKCLEKKFTVHKLHLSLSNRKLDLTSIKCVYSIYFKDISRIPISWIWYVITFFYVTVVV